MVGEVLVRVGPIEGLLRNDVATWNALDGTENANNMKAPKVFMINDHRRTGEQVSEDIPRSLCRDLEMSDITSEKEAVYDPPTPTQGARVPLVRWLAE